LAQGTAGLRGWRRYGAALLLGALAVLAQAPYGLPFVLLVSFSGLVWLLDGTRGAGRAFFTGWVFGLGYFVAGLYWTGLSMLVDAERFAVFLPFAILGLPSALAIYCGLAAALWRFLARPGLARVALLAVVWAGMEYLRGILFTGFPWNAVGYAWTASDATMQAAAYVGINGLNLLTVLAAAMPAVLAERDMARWRAWWPVAAVFLGLSLMAAGGAWRLSGGPDGVVPGVKLRIVQGNIPQALKWQRDLRPKHLIKQIGLSNGPGREDITHVIWPETAVPFFLSTEPAVRTALKEAVPEGGLLITGAPRRTPPEVAPLRLWNSLHALDGDGRIAATYDKMHLVPFGEYLPFRPLLAAIGFSKLTEGTRDYDRGLIGGPLHVPGLPPFRPLICYEVVFPDEVGAGGRPGWLVNITNDAWFGDSSGPYQHFAMARMRAVELGVPLVRAANTGISAVVDPHGRVIASLGLGREGVVDAPLPAALTRSTLYGRFGDGPFWFLFAVCGLLCFFGIHRAEIRK
jgi:apolipoprotein N-acyltransferase